MRLGRFVVDFFAGGAAPSSSHRRPTWFTTPLTVGVLRAAQFHRAPLSGPLRTLRHDRLRIRPHMGAVASSYFILKFLHFRHTMCARV
jgi:hypothetical protein